MKHLSSVLPAEEFWAEMPRTRAAAVYDGTKWYLRVKPCKRNHGVPMHVDMGCPFCRKETLADLKAKRAAGLAPPPEAGTQHADPLGAEDLSSYAPMIIGLDAKIAKARLTHPTYASMKRDHGEEVAERWLKSHFYQPIS